MLKDLHTDLDGTRRWLANEVRRLCDRVVWCQSSRRSGDLDADLDALEEQRIVTMGSSRENRSVEAPTIGKKENDECSD